MRPQFLRLRLHLSLHICLLLSLSLNLVHAQSCQDASVELNADVQNNPPRITLHWVPNANATQYTITRKLKNSSSWGATLATFNGDVNSFTDTAVLVGSSYEYRVIRSAASYTGYGYINSGIEVPVVESRGNLILVVDNTFTTSLQTEIDQWITDAEGDGWRVTKIDADRAATAVQVKAQIKQAYDLSTPKAKCVFILGHVPVPYSGELNPDGHPDHVGAWPTDTYYADLNGTWTDMTVNNTVAGDNRNDNVPGDGKFDQSLIPSDVELQIGRVDFANMPSFAASEEELLRNYLNKDHGFRNKLFTTTSRGLVDDNFGYFGGEAFASTGYKNIGTIVGSGNVVANDYLTTLADSNYLWSYGCGGGWFQGASGIGSTSDFANSHTQSVFTMLFGSYFGDWDSQDNFLRAPLAQGLTLTNAWSGRPHWVFHQMALGETIGYCARTTQNNNTTYFSNYGARFVSIGLMGDPTLRNDIIAPVSKLDVANEGFHVKITWEASPDPVMGYNIYRKRNLEGAEFERINNEPIMNLEYTDSCLRFEGDVTYMVRALNLQVTPSGSYYNMSQGVSLRINHVGTPDLTADAIFEHNGQTVTFTSTSIGSIEHYLWLFGDGESSTEQNPMHQYNDGLYLGTLIVSNVCTSDSIYLEVLILTGTKDATDDSLVMVWPNPAKDEVHVAIHTDSHSAFQLQMFTMEGKLVLEKDNLAQQEIIQLPKLSPGVYTFLLHQDDQLYRRRVFIE